MMQFTVISIFYQALCIKYCMHIQAVFVVEIYLILLEKHGGESVVGMSADTVGWTGRPRP